MREMITEDKRSLVIFRNGIEVDLNLPKHVAIDEEVRRKQKERRRNMDDLVESDDSTMLNPTPIGLEQSSWGLAYGGLKAGDTYAELVGLDVHKVNILMGETLRTRIFEPESIGENHWNRVRIPDDQSGIPGDAKTIGAIRSLIDWIDNLKKKYSLSQNKQLYSLDVLQFFAEIKGIAKNSPEANAYVDRTRGYIQALINADAAGQTALKERLLGGLIMNKYESALYAVGKYYVVEESQVIDFARKCEKGLSLTYIKNYIRPIPKEVIDAMNELNKMEIFDNYVILHFDPERKSFEETFKEKEKRRDPILFGVIKGSKRLYYVTDWVDEYCDLTLDKFAEVLQKPKDEFKMKEKIY